MILGFVALIFWVYAIVDVSAQPPTRHRAVSKPVWIAVVVLLPVLGAILWFTVGRGGKTVATAHRAPDDDPEFLGRIAAVSDQDERIRRLEEELAQLDAEDDDPKWNPPANPAAGPKPEPPVRGADLPDDDDTRGQRGAVG
nr:PLD nuclease N-terminal domain-containing protein [Microbacterium ulmi]